MFEHLLSSVIDRSTEVYLRWFEVSIWSKGEREREREGGGEGGGVRTVRDRPNHQVGCKGKSGSTRR
jgi:hypothetical protein